MHRHSVSDIRNIVLLGHGASGKTSLADLMLYKAGENSRVGSPDDGTSMLDTDDEAKHRKHTITTTVCHLDHNDRHFNFIDAPGMPDFVGQVFGALRATETALITVNAHSGIEVSTRKAFQQAGEAGLGRIFVINKCDDESTDFPQLVENIRAAFGPSCALMNVPVGIGSNLHGVISTVHLPDTIPDDVVIDPREANQQVLDAAVEADEELMMRYLEGETLTAQELEGAISKAIASGTLIPIFCTSIRRDIGIQELMAGLAAYSPAPTDVPRFALQDEDKVPLSAGPEEPLVAQVFKTRIDPFVAKMSYLRIFSGTLRKDESLMNSRTQKPIKISQIMSLQGSHHDNITEAGPGDIVAVVKIDDLRTGDTLTSGDGSLRMPCIPFPKPMIGLAVEPASQADQAKISLALHKIEEEDPTFYVEREEQTHEMVMHGMSELHLQVVQSRLHDREKVDIITHAPKIPYHETISGMSEGSYRHKKQSGGSGQFAEVHMKLSPCPHGIDPEEYFTKDRFESMRSFHYDPQLNFAFVDRISGGSIPNQFIPAVEKGVRERMSQGVVAGFQVQDVVVELFFGKDHPVDSNETAFKLAGSHCFRELFEQARPTLLEPIVSLDITIPDDKIGDITGDLNTRRGRMEGIEEVPGGLTQIHAKAPLAEVMTYARALSSMTAGQGSFGMEFSHYEPVPPNEQAKIIASAAKSDDAA